MGENPSPPYRATRAQEPDPTTDATAALSHRLRLAAGTPWAGDRCDTEAAAFITELRTRGWTPPRPVPTQRPTPANPAIARLRAEEARAAIRANRPAPPTTGPSDDADA